MKVLSLLTLFLFSWMMTPAQAEVNTAESADLEIIAVRMYAEWCGYCKQLDPRVHELKKSFQGEAVLFTWFDQTDDFAKEQSAKLAQLTGLQSVYEKYEGKTGVLLLIDAKTGEILTEIDHTWSKEQITKEIRDRLS